MKKVCLVIIMLSSFLNNALCQLPDNTVAPDFTVTDINGNSHNLYNYLQQGYDVIIEFNAAWCDPCYYFHASGQLDTLYKYNGPIGMPGVDASTTNSVMVIFIDTDGTTTNQDLAGPGSNSFGNWLAPNGSPVNFPICNPSTQLANSLNSLYNIQWWPSIYQICPNRLTHMLTNSSPISNQLVNCPNQLNGDNVSIVQVETNLQTCGEISADIMIQNLGTTDLMAIQLNTTVGGVTYPLSWNGNLPPFGILNLNQLQIFGNSFTAIDFNIQLNGDVYLADNNLTKYVYFGEESSANVKFDIQFNEVPEDFSFKVFNSSDVVVFSRDYSQSPIPADLSSVIESFNVPYNDCYIVKLKSEYGIGLNNIPFGGSAGSLHVYSETNTGDVFSEIFLYDGTSNFTELILPFTINNQVFAGCNNSNACNYSNLAEVSLGCVFPGCTNSLACNFNPSAGCDDGSCHFTNASCNDNNANTILDAYNSSCNCIGIPYTYGTIASSSNTICPEITSSSLAINNSPTGIVNYSLQWYFKTGNNPAPTGSNTSGWNLIPGATASSLTVDAFTGTRTYACFVTPDASYGISGSWMSGAKVLTYSSFAAQTIIGNPNITPFNAYNYIVNPIPGHTYNWAVTNGAVASGQGTSNVSIMWGQNGPYQLTLTESDGTCSGSSYLFAVNNNCSISVSAASSTNNTFCAGTTLQLQAATSASGITYQWYLNGTLIPNETNQNISVSAGGNYQVSINQNGCTAVSNIVSINQLPSAIIPNILVEQANAGCAGGEATLTVSGGTYTNLLWNNGLTASSINVNASGDFSITAIDENGCAVSAGPVSVNFSILDPVPVCIVTVDQVTGKNNVVWEPVTSDLINSYVVLKETNVANEYAQIGTVAYGSNGIFEDVNSDPQIQANRYKLALIDTCGILSSASNFHKTIHLTANQGIGSNVNLIWSDYEGFDFGSYSIYRGSSASSLNLLTTIASNLNSFTDVNPPTGETYYMIEVAGVSCDPQRTLVYSHSNILDSTVGIEEFTSTRISLYPNPASTSITLQVSTPLIGEEYVVFDTVGKVIYKNRIQSTNEVIHLENFNTGNYFIKINEVVKRFEVIK
jgi:hypothetical protein